jgi:hypothetical protein
MALRLKYPRNGSAYLRALELCEKYAFRVYQLLGKRSNAGRSSLYLDAYALYAGDIELEAVLDNLAGLIHQYAPDDEFQARFQLGSSGDWYRQRGVKYLLYEYEEHLSVGTRVRMPWEMLEGPDAKPNTIEHILPQSPEHVYWTQRFDDAARLKYTDDIGNLCLTFDNSAYGRKPFPQKKGEPGSEKPCYASGNLFMERELARFNDWNSDSLLARRDKIVQWARQQWNVPKSSVRLESAPEDEDQEDA